MALTSKAEASLAANYNPQGAMGGLFAPAYVPGYAPAEKAVMGWQSGRGLSGTELQQTAMPGAWQAPVDTNPWTSGGVGFSRYGPNLADSGPYSFGMKSTIDPSALRAAAQNTPYDMPGRREQIAQQLASNEMAQAAYEKKQEEQMAAFMAMQAQQQPQQPVFNGDQGGG